MWTGQKLAKTSKLNLTLELFRRSENNTWYLPRALFTCCWDTVVQVHIINCLEICMPRTLLLYLQHLLQQKAAFCCYWPSSTPIFRKKHRMNITGLMLCFAGWKSNLLYFRSVGYFHLASSNKEPFCCNNSYSIVLTESGPDSYYTVLVGKVDFTHVSIKE